MIKEWPILLSNRGKEVTSQLSSLCDQMEAKEITKVEAHQSLIDILQSANDRSGGRYSELCNGKRKHEFYLLTSIVNSIYSYFIGTYFMPQDLNAIFHKSASFWAYSGSKRVEFSKHYVMGIHQ